MERNDSGQFVIARDEIDQINEAFECADAMDAFRTAREGKR
jgi:hypothetical protein